MYDRDWSSSVQSYFQGKQPPSQTSGAITHPTAEFNKAPARGHADQRSDKRAERNSCVETNRRSFHLTRGVFKAEEGAAEEHPALVGVFIFLAMFSRVCLVSPGAHRLGSPPVSPSIPPTCDFQLRAAGASSRGFHFVSWGHLL